jgi:anti-sigma regulatory factor (Ser/Thr protein kinase)
VSHAKSQVKISVSIDVNTIENVLEVIIADGGKGIAEKITIQYLSLTIA